LARGRSKQGARRGRVAAALLRSVDPEEDDDAAETWVAELNRRSASIENGTTQLIDAGARCISTVNVRFPYRMRWIQ
jgi:hypothetical protein